jgi:hypothetical protein
MVQCHHDGGPSSTSNSVPRCLKESSCSLPPFHYRTQISGKASGGITKLHCNSALNLPNRKSVGGQLDCARRKAASVGPLSFPSRTVQSLVPRQLPTSPVRILARRVEHASTLRLMACIRYLTARRLAIVPSGDRRSISRRNAPPFLAKCGSAFADVFRLPRS